MTGHDTRHLLNPAEFSAVFDAATRSVFRLETRQEYAVAADDRDLTAFRTGAPRPVRSVRTSPWLRRIAVQTAAGVSWSRLRVVSYPLTEYTRFELVAYVESQAAGEDIRITEEAPPLEDFWLIDGGTSRAVAVAMHYDGRGALLGREKITDPGMLAELDAVREQAWVSGVELNVWLTEAASA